MRRNPKLRPENQLAEALDDIERLKELMSRISDGMGLAISPGSGPGTTTPPFETSRHVLYGSKHTKSLRVTAGAGLAINFEEGPVWMAGVFYSIAAGSLTLADDDVNYVFVDNVGVVVDNVTGFPDDSAPLAQVTTAAGVITVVADRRAYLSARVVFGGTLPTYTITNDVLDRVFNANAITLHELADVVATLIDDVAALHP